MFNVFAITFVSFLLCAILAIAVYYFLLRAPSREEQLESRFLRLSQSILDSMEGTHRTEAAFHLGLCLDHLRSFLRYQERANLLCEMRQELNESGVFISPEIGIRVQNDIQDLFEELDRISMAAAINMSQSVAELKTFTTRLQYEQVILEELTSKEVTPFSVEAKA